MTKNPTTKTTSPSKETYLRSRLDYWQRELRKVTPEYRAFLAEAAAQRNVPFVCPEAKAKAMIASIREELNEPVMPDFLSTEDEWGFLDA